MLPSTYQEFIYTRSYSRWVDEQKRRETWEETVARYSTFFYEKFQDKLKGKYLHDYNEAINSIRRLDVMPSMRALWTAGPALEFDNVVGYNCAYTELDDISSFTEVLYILMNGAGVGISVERQVIANMPTVQLLRDSNEVIVFEDSKQGWAEGFLALLGRLFHYGQVPTWDLSKIRPKGSRLNTFGGRASGPEPLHDLLHFVVNKVRMAQGRRLNSEECADICCKIAEVVVVGGVRRSAILLLTNPSDRRMQAFKSGNFWELHPHRRFANISSCYTEKPDPVNFLEDFLALMKSGSGERGFVSRESLQNTRRLHLPFGLNPCGEVILKPRQFCNLTEVVVRTDDDLNILDQKVTCAAILGTLQATLSDFKFLSPAWKKNTEEDRLLGVSLTGIMDHPHLYDGDTALDYLRFRAQEVNREWAALLGINPAAAATCVKPSGTVSQLVNSSSGMHRRFAQYYIRRVRVAAADPLCKLLQSQGVPWNPEVGETLENCTTAVFDFPQKAPEKAILTSDCTALAQLGTWKTLKLHYTDHNPSVTIFVMEHEWTEVAAWVYRNWDIVGGITFLPFSGGSYSLMPYEEISVEKFSELSAAFPQVDFGVLSQFELEDCTQGSREFACSGGACEL